MASATTSERARFLLSRVRAIQTAVEEAEREAQRFFEHVDGVTPEDFTLVRLKAEVNGQAHYLWDQLGNNPSSEFNPKWLVEEAVDLVELCELAEREREPVTA